jgi:hypothetical protein
LNAMQTAIVVNAYNRPAALARLLRSLARAHYPSGNGAPLIISIDRGGSDEVRAVADQFDWPFGPKQVLLRDQHLGLLRHFFACGDLTEQYDSIIYLEDDLLVSPVFYDYAAQALAFYRDDDRIGGVSLYGLWFNGYTQQPFVPLPDGADVFFVQVPYTQGLALTRAQWADFMAWRTASAAGAAPTVPLHEAWARFDREDWFPILARYVIATGRYFVFPRVSLTTGCGDAGTHFAQASRWFETPLQSGKCRYDLKPLPEADAVYDSFFELQPDRLNRLTDQLRGYDYTVDLYATKSRANLRGDYVLTSRRCRRPIKSFGTTRWPLEANVIEPVAGADIHLCRTEDMRWDGVSQLMTWYRTTVFFTRGRPPRLRTVLKWTLAQALTRWMRN